MKDAVCSGSEIGAIPVYGTVMDMNTGIGTVYGTVMEHFQFFTQPHIVNYVFFYHLVLKSRQVLKLLHLL